MKTMELDFRMVTDREELAAILTRIRKCGRVSLDLETTSQDPMRAEIVGIGLSYEEGSAVYVPVGHTLFRGPGAVAPG